MIRITVNDDKTNASSLHVLKMRAAAYIGMYI